MTDRMSLTMELLRAESARAAMYDPLYDKATGEHRVKVGMSTVYLGGYDDETGYADDLLIVVLDDAWVLCWREPGTIPWRGGRLYSEWSDLVGQAYSL